MDQEIKQRVTNKDNWFKGLYMILFGVINYLVQFVIYLVALFQFVTHLFIGKPNQRLVTFGQSLSSYSFQIMQYLTFNREEKPYPFADWPSAAIEKVTEKTHH